LAIPAATLNGLAFALPLMAFTASQRTDTSFSSIFRFIITPLYLLGGAFFPISKLPIFLQAVAWASPLAHGVELCRGLVLGNLAAGPALVHVTVLMAYTIAGLAFARPLLTKRLVK
jgi:lipooligosaccharide transport system permease protein